jgi:uroporphyrin-III C-methyltransferase/precorrin-2 dehydrogenase/sirohydrochlorin ferrochelatase
MSARLGVLNDVASSGGSVNMTALARLPIFLGLDGRRAVVAGGTPAAAWKAELLSAAGATVDVYAPSVCEELAAIAANPPRGAVTLHRRKWNRDDLAGRALAIGACESDGEAETFAAAARAARILINVIDKPNFSDFSFGSIVNRSPLIVAISTDGAAPVFAQAIRAKIEMLLPHGFGRWVAAAARWRITLKKTQLTFAGRLKFWQLFTAHAVAHPDGRPDEADFERWVAEVKRLGSAVDEGSITLVAAGHRDPKLLTVRAVRALQSADVILFDERIASLVVYFARREARKISIDTNMPAYQPDDVKALMIDLAKSGKRVVRLSSCHAMNSAAAEAEITACRTAGIAAQIVSARADASDTAILQNTSSERESAIGNSVREPKYYAAAIGRLSSCRTKSSAASAASSTNIG